MPRFNGRVARRSAAGLLLGGWLGMAQAGPDLDPGALFRYLPSHRSTLQATLKNRGDTTAFVNVELAEVTFGVDGQLQERPLASEDGLARALWATPPRAIVAAGGEQRVRLIYRGPRTQERYFRVRYLPVAPKAGDAFALQPDEAKAYVNALKAGVGVLKGIGTLLIVPPAQARYATRLDPTEQGLRIANEGEATIEVTGARYCVLATETCELVGALPIRPGRAEVIERREGQAFHFELVEGNRTTTHVYPRGG